MSNTPPHLLVLQHGLHGKNTDFYNVCKNIGERFGSEYFIHAATSNASIRKTQDGIINAGNRLVEEILSVVSNASFTKISIVGHSLGGLIVRYAIGKLYESGLFDKIVPVHFVSITVPNVGSRRPPRSTWNNLVSVVTSTVLQQTGKELMLEDITSDGVPLLVLMAQKDTIFMKGLASFRNRVLYSNVCNDFQVPYCTAAIVHKNPYLSGKRVLKFFSKYPHIVDVGEEPEAMTESNKASKAQPVDNKFVDNLFASDAKGDHLRAILTSLQTLSWKRYDVVFNNWLSHTHVVMKSRWLNSAGLDVVQHMVDNLPP